MQAGLAIWDVCHSAKRTGSLDSAITADSVQPNAIDALLRDCPDIALIAFNGQAAASLFRKHVRLPREVEQTVLPSTSPAHARLRFEDKLAQWRVLQTWLAR